MSRSTSASSTVTTTLTTSNAGPRNMAVKTTARPTATLSGLATDTRIFVTNLCLLDLDLREDWPGITIQTFSAKNSDQKQRIGGAEWALFRLFEMWDPNETAQKLQPFFPPLEPLQSLNLRAALYRCLNELKKNGVLGRETVLRKTMLDECKGDKFLEILAFFSNLVLKKILAAQKRHDRSAVIARKLATTSSLSTGEQQSLLPLAIAHKAALVNVIRRKDEQRHKFKQFEMLLDTKAASINSRIRKSIETPRMKKPVVPQKKAEAVKELSDNWIGNPKWLNVMLHGDDVPAEDVFLTGPFDKIWNMVEKGYKVEHVSTEIGLLEDLQSRVQEQQSRLQKWKNFHEELKEDQSKPTGSSVNAPVAAKEFKFDDHARLHLPSKNQKGETKAVQRKILSPEYQEILSNLDVELANISSNKTICPSLNVSRNHLSSVSITQSPVRSRKNIYEKTIEKEIDGSATTTEKPWLLRNNSFANVPVLNPSRQAVVAVTPVGSEATHVGYDSTVPSALPSTSQLESSIASRRGEKHLPEPTPPTSDRVLQNTSPSQPVQESPTLEKPATSPEPSPYYPSDPPIPTLEIPEINPEEALADQIINSIGNATPSPVKKPQPRMSLSLLERTRMTMSRTTSFQPLPESPNLPLPSMPPPPLISVDPETERQVSLLERTRQSMVAMQSQPRRQSLAPRQEKRKSRSSLFPVNQFDTPRTRKSFEKIEEAKSVERTPTEVLFSDKVDYDRVFKSRPRIATSPIFSPAVVTGYQGGGDAGSEEDFDEGVTGIDLGDVDRDGDSDEGGWAESPSRRKGVR